MNQSLRPLSAHAWGVLTSISVTPVPRQSLNPGVSNRLLAGDLVESYLAPSPYKSHEGRPMEHLRITEAGQSLLDARWQPE